MSKRKPADPINLDSGLIMSRQRLAFAGRPDQLIRK
jgi:hypothetical protein